MTGRDERLEPSPALAHTPQGGLKVNLGRPRWECHQPDRGSVGSVAQKCCTRSPRTGDHPTGRCTIPSDLGRRDDVIDET